MFNRKFKIQSKIQSKKLKDEIKVLKEENKSLEQFKKQDEKKNIENIELKHANNEIETKLRLQAEKLRDQTEADLFFTSAKICMELLNGKKKEDISQELQQQIALRREMQLQQAQAPAQSLPGWGFLDGSIPDWYRR